MHRRIGVVLAQVVAFIGLVLAGTTMAQPSQAEPLVDRAELEAWADSYYGQAIAEKRTPGIIISVVQDGEILFAKGYGYSDYGKKTPADPDKSGFVIGSVTKTFIATAIGQLVDRGRIESLDDPANKYLKRVKLPGARGAKVTIRQLLNHRAGFEDAGFGYLDPSGAQQAIPLSAQEIERFMPEIVREPGGSANYSNWSFSLLGFLIEDVTGARLDSYLKANIFDPLGMTHTSLIYGEFPANVSLNYVFEKDGTPVAQPASLPHPWISPAGAIVSTATDMARYMRAHVLRGEDGGYPLVSPEMFRILQTESYRNAPISNGFAHTFFTTNLNGSQTIEHGGGAPGFQTMMLMIPGKRFGFFISSMQGGLAEWASYTADEKARARQAVQGAPSGFELRESFIDKFLQRPEVPATGAKSDLSKLAGVYWNQRRSFTTLDVLAQAFDPAAVLRITLAKDRQGLLLNGWGPYRDLGGGVFVSPTGRNVWKDHYEIDLLKPPHIAFTLDQNGKVAYLTPGLADQVWAPASRLFNPQFMLLAFLGFGAVTLTGALMFLWPHRSRSLLLADCLTAIAVVPTLAFPALIFVGFARGDSLVNQMALGDKTRLWGMIAAANATVAIALALAAVCVMAWLRPATAEGAGWGRVARKVHLTAITFSTLGLVAVFWFFNLVGIHMPG